MERPFLTFGLTLAHRCARRIESTFPKWLEEFIAVIDSLFPLEQGVPRSAIDDVPPSRIEMAQVESGSVSVKEGRWAKDIRWAKVRKLDRVTPSGWFQDVRSVELELPEGIRSVRLFHSV